MIIRTISFTENGDKLNNKISNILKSENNKVFAYGNAKGLIKREDNLFKWSENAFKDSDALIFIGAVGIAVRAISSFVESKDKDPAVIVCDEKGKYVIPILSGHIGGGNSLANSLAKGLNATAVITTATDLNNIWAVDNWAKENNYHIEDISKIKYISSALLKGEEVGIDSFFKIKGDLPKNVINKKAFKNGIVISPFLIKAYENTINIVPECITIGVGSRKGADENALIKLFKKICEEKNISEKAVFKIATIDIKKEEKAVLKLKEYLKKDLILYTAEELNEVEGEFSSSSFVKSVTGVDNVCERSAVRLAEGELIVEKTKGEGVTLAMAVIKESVRF